MPSNNFYTERIEKYLAGEMQAEETLKFEKDLSSDSELKEAYILHRNIVSHIEEEGNKGLKSFLEDIEKEEMSQESGDNNSAREFKLGKFVVGIAAGLAILFAFVWLFRGSQSMDSNAMFSQYYEAYPNQLTIIDRGDNVANDIQQTMTHYAKQDYQKAINGFDKILTNNENILVREELSFYKALSLLSVDNPTDAIEILDTLKNNNSFEYAEQVRWYIVMAQLKEGNESKVKNAIQDLLASGQSFKLDQTRAILTKLNADN